MREQGKREGPISPLPFSFARDCPKWSWSKQCILVRGHMSLRLWEGNEFCGAIGETAFYFLAGHGGVVAGKDGEFTGLGPKVMSCGGLVRG